MESVERQRRLWQEVTRLEQEDGERQADDGLDGVQRVRRRRDDGKGAAAAAAGGGEA